MSTAELEQVARLSSTDVTLRLAGSSKTTTDVTKRTNAETWLVGCETPTRPSHGTNESTAPTEQGQNMPVTKRPVVRLRRTTIPRRFEILQQWEGIISSVGEETVEADLHDLTTPGTPTEYVEIELDEIPVPDRELLAPGAVFYWAVGYNTSPGGQIGRVSEIRLRRTPQWSQRQLEAAKRRGQEMFNAMMHKEDNDASSAPKER